MKLSQFALPLLRALPPEAAHTATIRALQLGLGPREDTPDPPSLAVHALGHRFANPIGLAAGFDKNGEVPDQMLRLGFGFVEVGTVTPKPQAGNPKPRLFRLEQDRAVINRMGFNNQGLAAMVSRLEARKARPGLVGANIGANKDSADRINDYVIGLRAVINLCAYVTVNVSSPNTPGLRGLQDRSALEDLLSKVATVRAETHASTPLLLKIAPDLTPEAVEEIVDIALEQGLDGLILTNTTLARPSNLQSPDARESGGLSGAPLFAPSTAILKVAARRAAGRLTIIAAGGVASGADAYAKICAGAHLVQLYSALTYEGPDLVQRIKSDLLTLISADGFDNIVAAIGSKLHD